MNLKLLLVVLAGANFVRLVGVAAPKAQVIKPSPNLIVENIPSIPSSLAEEVGPYEHFIGAKMFSWSPDRKEMLVGVQAGDTVQVSRLSSPGAIARQITFRKDPILGATFEPENADAFIFSTASGGNEKIQFYRHNSRNGESTLLTDGKSRNEVGVLEHHGTRMAYTSNRRNGVDFDLYLMDVRDKQTDHLLTTTGCGQWLPYDWSEDGKQLLMARRYSVDKSELYIVNVATGKLNKISPKQEGAESIYYGYARFSKDGKGIYVITDCDSEFRRLAYFDSATFETRYYTGATPGDVETFQESEDGECVPFVINENGISKLYVLNGSTGVTRPISSIPTGVIRGIELHQNGHDLGFTLTSSKIPTDIFSVNLSTEKVTRWTNGEALGLWAESIREPKLVSWKSFDGLAISGLLYEPDPAKFPGKRPVIVDIHGGPESESRPIYLADENYFVDKLGIAILYPNIRGSTGFGKTFTKLDNGMLREHAYKDVGALLDWIPTQPNLDAAHVMVTGTSYGGTVAWAAAAFYSDKIACALPVVGCSNLVTFLENTEEYRRELRRVEYGDERVPEMRDYLEKIAPLNHVDLIHKPVFAVVGKNDPRVRWTESRQIVDKLQAQGTPTWFLIANDEGHGFAKKANQDFQFEATVMFVRKFLLGRSD